MFFTSRWLFTLTHQTHDIYRRDRERYGNKPRVEMYSIPREEITALIQLSGGKLLNAEEDSIAMGWESLLYTAVKR